MVTIRPEPEGVTSILEYCHGMGSAGTTSLTVKLKAEAFTRFNMARTAENPKFPGVLGTVSIMSTGKVDPGKTLLVNGVSVMVEEPDGVAARGSFRSLFCRSATRLIAIGKTIAKNKIGSSANNIRRFLLMADMDHRGRWRQSNY